MKRHRIIPLVWLLSVGCSFDLVDPMGQPRAAQLAVFLDVGDSWAFIVATLDPGVDADRTERTVADPYLSALGARLAPDTALVGGRRELRWSDTLDFAGGPPSLIRVVGPTLRGLLAPIRLEQTLRRRAGPADAAPWLPGRDLVLTLMPDATPPSPVGGRWDVLVEGWVARARPSEVVSISSTGALPDTIVIPGGWLGALSPDSLSATLMLTRDLRGPVPDSSYRALGSIRQIITWSFFRFR